MPELMASQHLALLGIRRIVEFEVDRRALTLRADFIEGANTQVDTVREFVRHIPNVSLILDHCGKLGLRKA